MTLEVPKRFPSPFCSHMFLYSDRSFHGAPGSITTGVQLVPRTARWTGPWIDGSRWQVHRAAGQQQNQATGNRGVGEFELDLFGRGSKIGTPK